MTRIAIIAANAIMRSGTETLLSKSGILPNCIVTFETMSVFLNQPEPQRFAVALLDDEPYFNNIEATIEQLLKVIPDLLIIEHVVDNGAPVSGQIKEHFFGGLRIVSAIQDTHWFAYID